jgi:lysophospholipase L1-like esterase
MAAFVVAPLALASTMAEAGPRDGFWERGLRVFAVEDKKAELITGGVVFLGSSSIRLWPTHDFFPDLVAVNRGISGSHLADARLYVDKTVFPYRPKLIVFYAGENDISSGSRPEHVLTEFQNFVQRVHEELTESKIAFISIKPSPIRRAIWSRMREANVLVELFCTSDERLRYVDVANHMLDREGNPRPELFREDGLHMNNFGYQLWTRILSPIVEEELARPPGDL